MKARWVDRSSVSVVRGLWVLDLGDITVRLVQESEFGVDRPRWHCAVHVGNRCLAIVRLPVTDAERAKVRAEAFTRKTVEALAKTLARMPNTKPPKRRR